MAWFRLIYYHIVYWTVGTTPEAHHYNLALTWCALNRHRNCIEHCKKYLNLEDSMHIRAIMGGSHAAMGEWEEARAAFRSIRDIWSEPSMAAALAEAEMKCGNVDEARKIVATVEASHPDLIYSVASYLDGLKSELEEAGHGLERRWP